MADAASLTGFQDDRDALEDPLEELLARQRKEKKALKEKVLSMKKSAKSGNRQKQKETNAEIEKLEHDLADRHEKELRGLRIQSPAYHEEPSNDSVIREPSRISMEELEHSFYKQVTISSRTKKKQMKHNDAIRRMQEAIQIDRENAATSLRVTEMIAIRKILDERGLDLVEIAPDGDCLYNAVADQIRRTRGYEQATGKDMRRRAAKYIREHKDDFIPFLVNEDDESLSDIEFEKYCHGVENESKDGGVWGGEPELNALSQSLERPIELIQPMGPPVIFGEEYKTKQLIVVYQRHAYQLGAHYNSTTSKKFKETQSS
ncbi:OTU-like cysteine protease [Dictyocaulus viviparus]|uniref:OTU-like cysteine protease n=1 Tax=Dictyocaulus viviparus TaxID=29172 RepID=A0A0D8XY49_DICVI|nr:OTU-like cysteine protease [Dictyocaulus viviparus]